MRRYFCFTAFLAFFYSLPLFSGQLNVSVATTVTTPNSSTDYTVSPNDTLEFTNSGTMNSLTGGGSVYSTSSGTFTILNGPTSLSVIEIGGGNLVSKELTISGTGSLVGSLVTNGNLNLSSGADLSLESSSSNNQINGNIIAPLADITSAGNLKISVNDSSPLDNSSSISSLTLQNSSSLSLNNINLTIADSASVSRLQGVRSILTLADNATFTIRGSNLVGELKHAQNTISSINGNGSIISNGNLYIGDTVPTAELTNPSSSFNSMTVNGYFMTPYPLELKSGVSTVQFFENRSFLTLSKDASLSITGGESSMIYFLAGSGSISSAGDINLWSSQQLGSTIGSISTEKNKVLSINNGNLVISSGTSSVGSIHTADINSPYGSVLQIGSEATLELKNDNSSLLGKIIIDINNSTSTILNGLISNVGTGTFEVKPGTQFKFNLSDASNTSGGIVVGTQYKFLQSPDAALQVTTYAHTPDNVGTFVVSDNSALLKFSIVNDSNNLYYKASIDQCVLDNNCSGGSGSGGSGSGGSGSGGSGFNYNIDSVFNSDSSSGLGLKSVSKAPNKNIIALSVNTMFETTSSNAEFNSFKNGIAAIPDVASLKKAAESLAPVNNNSQVIAPIYESFSSIASLITSHLNSGSVGSTYSSTLALNTNFSTAGSNNGLNAVVDQGNQNYMQNIYRYSMSGGNDGKIIDEKNSNGNMWVKAFGSTINQGKTDNIAGYDSSSYGIVFGMDRKVLDTSFSSHTLGVSASYASSNIDQKTYYSQTLSTNLYAIGLYNLNRFFDKKFYNKNIIQYGTSSNESSRQVSNGSTSFNADGSYSRNSYLFETEVGYDFAKNNFLITPSLAFQSATLAKVSFTESGPLGMNVTNKKFTNNMMSAGVNVQRKKLELKLFKNTFLKDSYASYNVMLRTMRNFSTEGQVSTMSYTAGGSSFTAVGSDISKNIYEVGVGFGITPKKSLGNSFSVQLNLQKYETSATGKAVFGKYSFYF